MRIGSDEARTWARKLHFGDVRAKSILMAICNYVDEDGCAYPGIPTLAQDTDQSDDSVRRRLKDLEAFKVLARFPRYVDDSGRINTDGRGRRTSDELRLMLATTQNVVDEAKLLRAAKDDESEADPRQQRGAQEQGSDDAEIEVSPRTAATGVDSEPSVERNPPTPLKGGFDQVWEDFEAAFTSDGTPIARQSIAEQLLAALNSDELLLVTKAAAGYNLWRKAEKKPPAKLSAQTFLRERGSWAKWAGLVPAPPAAPPKFIPEEDPLFNALSVVHRIRTGNFFNQKGLQTNASPTKDLLALAPFDRSDIDAWIELDATKDKDRIAAWREKILTWTGQRLETQRVAAVGPDGQQLVRTMEGLGKPIDYPVWREVVRVPFEWPPRKDGTFSEAEDLAAVAEQSLSR